MSFHQNAGQSSLHGLGVGSARSAVTVKLIATDDTRNGEIFEMLPWDEIERYMIGQDRTLGARSNASQVRQPPRRNGDITGHPHTGEPP